MLFLSHFSLKLITIMEARLGARCPGACSGVFIPPVFPFIDHAKINSQSELRAIKSPAEAGLEGVTHSLLCFGREKREDRLTIRGKVYCWLLNIWNKKLVEVGLVGNKKPLGADWESGVTL
jgi:hypothetical protein